jgi:tRNA (Thr-GGU) A37 N-methylase/catechol 2,3-dioxygenase-like lactoylglutathione lyase family enzyme
MRPIGTVVGGRTEAADDNWESVRAAIELDATEFGPDALAGIEDFSHLEVVYHFHLVAAGTEERGARRPRGRADWPLVGIFAQRGKRRPGRIGVSRCRLLAVDGTRLEVEELDAIDGTPVLDVKPVMHEFGPRGAVRQPDWASELMADYYTPNQPPGPLRAVTALHHVQVSCPAGSEQALRGFYAGVLGMTEVSKPPVLAARGGAWFRSGTAELHCGVETDFRPALKAHPCLLVQDVDSVAEAVARAGGEVRWDDNVPGVRRFHTDDPVGKGNRIELQQS